MIQENSVLKSPADRPGNILVIDAQQVVWDFVQQVDLGAGEITLLRPCPGSYGQRVLLVPTPLVIYPDRQRYYNIKRTRTIYHRRMS